MGFPGATVVKNPLARWMEETQETRVRSLCREDPLEKEITTYSRILAWKIPWTEEPGGLRLWGRGVVKNQTQLMDLSNNKKHFYAIYTLF